MVESTYGCYLTSHTADAALLADLIRGHCGAESRLHWVLDMAFDEDRCRIRRGNAPDNFALLRKAPASVSCKPSAPRQAEAASANHRDAIEPRTA
jgi:predicted transposase YbfD/YdcC